MRHMSTKTMTNPCRLGDHLVRISTRLLYCTRLIARNSLDDDDDVAGEQQLDGVRLLRVCSCSTRRYLVAGELCASAVGDDGDG